MSFCTAINCMDGRTQEPVISFLKRRFSAKYVDSVTEAGPVGVLTADPDSARSKSIYARVDISVQEHASSGIAIVAHHDCAGNPIDEAAQKDQLKSCVQILKTKYPEHDVIALWVDQSWWVSEIS